MEISIRALVPQNCSHVEAGAAASTFWELPPTAAAEDAAFDKEVWMQRVLLEWGICGYTALVGTGDVGSQLMPAATVFFAPVNYMQGAEQLPSGPVSPDAILLSAVHVALPYMGLYLEHQLIDAVLTEAHRRGIKAVEAFARKEPGDGTEAAKYAPESYKGWQVPQKTDTGDPVADRLSVAPMLNVEILEAEGFQLVQDHPLFPRYRAEISSTTSMFAIFAEDDHVEVNGSEKLNTVTGGGKMRRAVRAANGFLPRGSQRS